MHSADSSPFTAKPARPSARRRAALAESRIAPDTRVVVIGQGADIHRALTHPVVELGRFVIVDAVDVDIEVGLRDQARQSIEQRLEWASGAVQRRRYST